MANVSVEMDSKKLALLCRKLADERKAENIVVLDVRKLSSVTDFFVIVTGTSDPHLRAIVDEITTGLHEGHGLHPHTIEGGPHAAWKVLDYYDVIVHVMRADVRQHYDLEGLWNDAPRVTARAPAKKKAPRASKAQKTEA
jgi:ribosome-associated protein